MVDLPEGHTSIKGRWVYAIHPENHVKARFIAKGFTQIFGIDYEETFSPVAQFETVHLMFALAALHNWEMKALDVNTAFLFGGLDKELYMVQPEDFIVQGQESKAALQCNKYSSYTSLLSTLCLKMCFGLGDLC